MRLTVLWNLCILHTVSGVQVNAGVLLTVRDYSYLKEESLVYQHRRLGGNESTSSWISHSGIHQRQLIIEIGLIVGYILLAIGILCIIMPWILSWKTTRNGIFRSQHNLYLRNSADCTESILIPPIDKEEIRIVLDEYERITAQLHNWSATDFTRCQTIKPVFKNTRPVVTPFVRKSSTLSPNNKSLEHIAKPTISDDVFVEKSTAFRSKVNLSTLSGLEEVDSRSEDDKSRNSPDIGRGLSFYKKDGKFQIYRSKRKLEKFGSRSTNTSTSAGRLSIQLGSNRLPGHFCTDSTGFQFIF